MSEKIVVPDLEENADRCLCPTCPTHNECMKSNEERLFCSHGKSKCDPEKRGCMCGNCPVWVQYELSSFYYCLEGAAKK